MIKGKISIIVPIYNIEEYLNQCLQSIQRQTYKNIEVICINDGSKDSSLSIAKEFSKKDSRFVVLEKENGGLSSARNMGLGHATGEYVMFVDGDDWIEPDAVEGALQAILDTNADCSMWTYMREYGQNSKKKNIFDGNCIFEEKQCRDLQRRIIGLFREELKQPENADAISSVCTKLLKREIIEKQGLRFTDTDMIGPWEDGWFSVQYFQHVKKAVYIDSAWYHYRKGSGGTNVLKYKPRLQEHWEKRQRMLKAYIQEHELDSTYLESLKNRNALNMISLSLNAVALPKCEAYNTLKALLSDAQYKEDLQAIRLCYLPLKWKVFYYLCKQGSTCGVMLLALYMQRAITRGNPV